MPMMPAATRSPKDRLIVVLISNADFDPKLLLNLSVLSELHDPRFMCALGPLRIPKKRRMGTLGSDCEIDQSAQAMNRCWTEAGRPDIHEAVPLPKWPDGKSQCCRLKQYDSDGVGPNAVNLRDMWRPCCLCGFLVLAAVGLLSCSWACVPDGAFPSRDSFCDIPADLWRIGGQA